MNRLTRRCGIIILSATILAMGVAVGNAKMIFNEDFTAVKNGKIRGGQIVPGRDGQQGGWRGPGGDRDNEKVYIEYDVKGIGLNPDQGTISFAVTRDEARGVRNPVSETMYSLYDSDGNELIALRIIWEGGFYKYPEISFYQPWSPGLFHYTYYNEWGQDITWPAVPFVKSVSRGQTVRIALTWGPGKNALYVDGVKLPAKVDKPFRLPEAIAVSTTLKIGGETSAWQVPHRTWGTSHSLIRDFRIYDVALDPRDLNRKDADLAIASIDHDALSAARFSGSLVVGDKLTVNMSGTPGAPAAFNIGRLADDRGKIVLDWRGFGVYLDEDKRTFAAGEIDLRQVRKYRIYASRQPFSEITEAMKPLEILDVDKQRFVIENAESGTPYFIAVVAVMRDGTFKPVISPLVGLPMTEIAAGKYQGTFEPQFGQDYPEAMLVGQLGAAGAKVLLADDRSFKVDTALRVSVKTEPEELPADEKSESKVTVTVTDANGNVVKDHPVKFVLATTSQYTGVIGGGLFKEAVGGKIKVDRFQGRTDVFFEGTTDVFGKIETTYVAGFAAKTAMIVARDMMSNDTGVGSVRTFIKGSAQVLLTEELPAVSSLRAGGYTLRLETSNDWLTADGDSQARLTATVSKDGKPVAGHRIGFIALGDKGSIKVVDETTDRRGEARALFTAGRKAGVAVIVATDYTTNLKARVQIELRSDAPAKINIAIQPGTLPADGNSKADILVTVTDINDNPSEGAGIEYAVSGGGKVIGADEVTDRRGEAKADYVAGNSPGTATVTVTVHSALPNKDDLMAARQLATAVPDFKFLR